MQGKTKAEKPQRHDGQLRKQGLRALIQSAGVRLSARGDDGGSRGVGSQIGSKWKRLAVELNQTARVSRYPLHSNNVRNAARIWAIRRTISPVTATCTDRVASHASTWEVAAFRTHLALKGPRTRPRYKRILVKLCLIAPCPQDATRPQFEDLLSNSV